MLLTTRTPFKSYDDASAAVKKLHLHSMQEWIDFSKGKIEGKTRPKDIPSNPWTIYKAELAARGEKFSINTFIGSPRKVAARKVAVRAGTSVRKISGIKVTPKVKSLVTRAVAKNKSLTYSKARGVLKTMHVHTRADFNALIRMKLLPKNFPVAPVETFKSDWKGWKAFCGTA